MGRRARVAQGIAHSPDLVLAKILNRNEEKHIRRRRGLSITAYVGANGSGKSLCMVRDTLPSLAAGRRVLSTVRLLDDKGRDHPLCEKFTDWRQLLTAEHCDVLMDEVTGIASSRDSSQLPTEVANFLVQLRRRDVQLRWSSPNWRRADTIIREVTKGVVVARGFMPDRTVLKDKRSDVGLWLPNRLFSFKTYDTTEYDEFTAGTAERIRPVDREVFVGTLSKAFRAYDTYDAVSIVGEQQAKGICLVCGGVRRPQRCTCEHH